MFKARPPSFYSSSGLIASDCPATIHTHKVNNLPFISDRC